MVMHGKTWKDAPKEERPAVRTKKPYKRDDVKKIAEKELAANKWYATFQRHSKWWWTDLEDPLNLEHGPFDTPLEADEAAFRYGQHL